MSFGLEKTEQSGGKSLSFSRHSTQSHLFQGTNPDRIYINRVDYGYMNYGLKSGAKYYFGQISQRPDKSRTEIALLILPKDSKSYDPYKKPKNFQTRSEAVTNILVNSKILSTEEKKEALNEHMNWNTEHMNPLPTFQSLEDKIRILPRNFQK